VTEQASKAALRPMVVGDIGGSFVVPDYQRGFRWGVEEVTRLLEDIRDSDGNYYLQPVVVKGLADSWELIDGQQRLTTLYLILSHIRTHLPTTELKYSLSYDTRPNSAAYLECPTEDDKDANIDFFFIFQASECIREWFNAADNPALAAVNFYKALSESVFVIWYEAPAEVDSRTLFTRLNVGRIPLTNAELVKAVLLSKIDRRDEVAAQWDSIERDLRRPEIWAFATGDSQRQATHISLLLDTLARQIGGSSRQPFHTFETLRERIVETSAGTVWEDVVQLYSLVIGWHDDHDLFHKIGYLISTGMSLPDFAGPALQFGRADFVRFLDKRIMQRINLTRTAFVELDYEHDYERCLRVLGLINVETVRRRGDRSHRYSFDAQASRSWSLEHIHAQSAEQLDEVRQWTSWLRLHRDALVELPEIDEEVRADLVERIDIAIPTISAAKFHQLEDEIVPLFTAEGSNGDGVHAISNLALLERGDNSALSNSCFEVKRREVLDRDRRGSYIPPATRNVFLKYYTDLRHQQLHFWGSQDRDAYLAALLDLVGPYLVLEDGDE
jgi:hypothetical protein